jgi:glycerophosphoryl diester phosphodiesterase
VPARYAFLDWPGPIVLAHRGGGGEQPENTMASFGAAVGLGYRYLETDVHATADGVVVCFHDDALDRLTEGTGLLATKRWAELRSLRVRGREPIPALDEVLETFPDVRVNIDPKHAAVVGPLVSRLRAHGAVDRVCVGSFSQARLAQLRRELGPALCTSLSPRGIAALRFRSWGTPTGRYIDAPCAQVPVRYGRVPVVDRRSVALAHRLGVAVHVWTVDDPTEAHRLLDLGVDGLITDRPTVLKQVLQARRQWVG